MRTTLISILIFTGVTATTLGIASSRPVKHKVTGRGTAEGRVNCWTCSDRLEDRAKREARLDAEHRCGNHMPPALVGEFKVTDIHLGLGQVRYTAEATFLCPQW